MGPNVERSKVGEGADLLISGEGGIAARHPRLAPLPAHVAPTLSEGFNTLGFRITPLACWRAHDMRFSFASSFPRPELRLELQGLERLISSHTLTAGGRSHAPPLAVFGHADPTGDNEFNKVLSGRRANCLFALLTRNSDIIEGLFSHPHGDDVWSDPALRTMLATVNPEHDFTTREEVLQRVRRDVGIRKTLFLAYADALCIRRDGTPFQVAREDFLDRNTDARAKGAVMGCGEFNPVMVFSEAEQREFASPSSKPKRDQENASNRRVVIFLFAQV